MQKSSKAPQTKGKKAFNIIAKTLAILSTIALVALLVNIFRFNILPTHLLIIITVIVVILAALNISSRKKKRSSNPSRSPYLSSIQQSRFLVFSKSTTLLISCLALVLTRPPAPTMYSLLPNQTSMKTPILPVTRSTPTKTSCSILISFLTPSAANSTLPLPSPTTFSNSLIMV